MSDSHDERDELELTLVLRFSHGNVHEPARVREVVQNLLRAIQGELDSGVGISPIENDPDEEIGYVDGVWMRSDFLGEWAGFEWDREKTSWRPSGRGKEDLWA
jgi:hypothetical protein